MESSSHIPPKQYPLTLDEAMENEMKHGRISSDPNVDVKKIRRTLSNKLSAQRSRNKMVRITRELEKRVEDLEAQIKSTLTPQLESFKEKKIQLQFENEFLTQELEKRSNGWRHREMEIEGMIAEIRDLKAPAETTQMNNHAADSCPEQIPTDFHFGQLNVSSYPSINFHQAYLQNHQEASSSAVLLSPAPDSAMERSDKEIKPAEEEKNANQQEFEDIDQYINFDAVNAADPSGFGMI